MNPGDNRTPEEMRELARMARQAYNARKRRWRDICNFYEERALALAKDPKSNVGELTRMVALVKELRDGAAAQRQAKLERRTKGKGQTRNAAEGAAGTPRSLSPEVLKDIEVLTGLM